MGSLDYTAIPPNEHLTVNQRVSGSSPEGGAKERERYKSFDLWCSFAFCKIILQNIFIMLPNIIISRLQEI